MHILWSWVEIAHEWYFNFIRRLFQIVKVNIKLSVKVFPIGRDDLVSLVVSLDIDLVTCPRILIIINMSNQKTMLSSIFVKWFRTWPRHIFVIPYVLSVFKDKIFIFVLRINDLVCYSIRFQRIDGKSICFICFESNNLTPPHEITLVCRIANRSKTKILVVTTIHNIPYIQDGLTFCFGIVKVWQSETMWKLMACSTDTIYIICIYFICHSVWSKHNTIHGKRVYITFFRPNKGSFFFIHFIIYIIGILTFTSIDEEYHINPSIAIIVIVRPIPIFIRHHILTHFTIKFWNMNIFY